MLLDARDLEDLRAAAENAQVHGARVVADPVLVLGLIEERQKIRAAMIREEYDIQESLAEAMGMTKDPHYGYPTGAHTAVTLALEMIDYCARLRAEAGAR